ncbi:hypothetical protein PVK06_031102 [Gossypium arboreum]|uniref:Uncharacterized protein n=1 Tax=Gossypium arboreum TaxID=29729 RepID=A0ABR0NQ38_GOSAR|nr:hypothetical protein PVK06_031102 [Gossypium arboreum]
MGLEKKDKKMCRFLHGKRSKNEVANLLATEGLRNGDQQDVNGGVPAYAVEMVDRDRRRSGQSC